MAAASNDLKRDRDRFVGFAFSAADLLLELDDRLAVRFASGALHKLTGLSPDQVEGRPFAALVAPTQMQLVTETLGAIARGGRIDPVGLTLRFAAESGEEATRPAVLGACRLPETSGYLVTLTTPPALHLDDVLAGRRDPLTGALSSDAFALLVSNMVARSLGESEQEAFLTLLHLEGLSALKQRSDAGAIAELMRNAMAYLRARSHDGESVGLIDHDKIGLLQAPGHDGGAPDSQGLARVIEQMARAADPSGKGLAVDHGALALESEGMNERDIAKTVTYMLRSFVEAPDSILALGGLEACFQTFMDQALSRVSEIKQTVAGRAFHLAYQPIVDLRTSEVHHYEGLCRLAGGKGPGEVFAFAEDVGLVEELDLAVCRQAVEALAKRFEAGGSTAIAVNLSGRSIESDLFVGLLHALCRPLGTTRRKLLFELTETSRIRDLDRAGRVLSELRAAGHPLCLDDFGKGNASFEYLQLLPFDYLKLDGKLVKQAAADRRAAAIVKAAVGFSHDLGLRCIAESIENREQLDWLAPLGVDYGQGWLFGKPARDIPMTVGNERIMAVVS